MLDSAIAAGAATEKVLGTPHAGRHTLQAHLLTLTEHDDILDKVVLSERPTWRRRGTSE